MSIADYCTEQNVKIHANISAIPLAFWPPPLPSMYKYVVCCKLGTLHATRLQKCHTRHFRHRCYLRPNRAQQHHLNRKKPVDSAFLARVGWTGSPIAQADVNLCLSIGCPGASAQLRNSYAYVPCTHGAANLLERWRSSSDLEH